MNDRPAEQRVADVGTTERFDAIVVGGGPGGSTAALTLARAGLTVCLLEKASHPRFHIGESILPRTTPLLKSLGLEAAVEALPRVPKYGAEFGFGNDFGTMRFTFTDGLLPGFPVFNIERSVFDRMLFEQAAAAGTQTREEEGVRSIEKLSHGDVEVLTTRGNTVRGRILIDASGHGCVVGRHLGTRQNFTDPELQKVAYFQHFENVYRHQDQSVGHPTIIMADEGWFWLIHINEKVTSVGFVTRPDFVKRIKVAPEDMLQWAIARCPVVRERMRDAQGLSTNKVLADFSYTCRPFAGNGYFLVGDAGCFLDPIFSTGVTLAMMSGHEAGKIAAQLLSGQLLAGTAGAKYARFVKRSTSPFWKLIRAYYRHSFRELFMNGTGPLQMHKAVISTLAGQVFPRPVWALRWRLRLFHLCVAVQEKFALVPRRQHFSLTAQTPLPASPPAPAGGPITGPQAEPTERPVPALAHA